VAPCIENLRSPPTARALLNRNWMIFFFIVRSGWYEWRVDSGAGGADRADESNSRCGDQGEGKLTSCSGILESILLCHF
jgi:hypothetical protein